MLLSDGKGLNWDRIVKDVPSLEESLKNNNQLYTYKTEQKTHNWPQRPPQNHKDVDFVVQ